jgi:DNA repair photolyase
MELRPVRNPPNPWATTDVEYLEGDEPGARLRVYEDHTKEILASNDSPDLGFRWSLNPYRGCFHACVYCYARPTHEYLSFGSGTDFDRKIVVKPRAPELLREALEKKSWAGELILFSGNTDCYQPLEASYRLTRACLEVCAEYKNPIGLITKAPLVERDIDVLERLAKVARLHVTVSIPFWDVEKARAMEPYVATPERRVHIIQKLAARGIPVGVNVAPVIPGLGDEEIGDVLAAARDAGATHAGCIVLRLPGPVKHVFEERLRERLPLRAEKVLRRVREMRGGMLYDPRFGKRQTGEGPYAEAISRLFEQTCRRLGFETSVARLADPPATTFERPAVPKGKVQLNLF